MCCIRSCVFALAAQAQEGFALQIEQVLLGHRLLSGQRPPLRTWASFSPTTVSYSVMYPPSRAR